MQVTFTNLRPMDLFENPLSPHFQALVNIGMESESDYLSIYDAIIIMECHDIDKTLYAYRCKDGSYEMVFPLRQNANQIIVSKDLFTLLSMAVYDSTWL